MSGVIAAVGASAAISIGVAHYQSEQIKAGAELQGKLSELNSQMAEIDGQEAYRQGITQQVQSTTQIDQAKAAQEAVLAESGVNISGSVADIVKESNLNAGLNLMDIESQAFNKRLGFQREAANRRSQSAVDSMTANAQAKNALISGYASAAQTGLSYAMKKVGPSDTYKGK